jgi:hypothetical protein
MDATTRSGGIRRADWGALSMVATLRLRNARLSVSTIR